MKIPTWIETMTEEVSKKNNIETPILVVRRIQRSYSGLQTSEGDKKKIIIRYSSTTPMWQKKMVVLHELAHCIAPDKAHHSDKFWEIAINLYTEYKLPIRKVLKNEKNYRKTAGTTFAKIKGYKVPKRKKKIMDTVAQMRKRIYMGSIIGIKDTPRGAWAVTEVNDKSWRGYHISKKLYKTLEKKKMFPIV